jgi:hypothetical protein
MKILHLLPMIVTLALLVPSAGASDAPAKRQSQKKAQPAGQTSLSGCVDERDSGRYILVDDAKLSPIAELKADDFPNEGFAKYLGQKVMVRGKISTEEGRTVFTVRKIEMVSETCAPARPSP